MNDFDKRKGGNHMKIRTPKFLFDKYDRYENIEYELEWMLGYCDKKIFADDFYQSIGFKTEFVECDISDRAIKVLEKIIKKINFDDIHSDDIESIINILYLTLYVLGGTN